MKHTVGYIVLIALMLTYRFVLQEPLLNDSCNQGSVTACDMLVLLDYAQPEKTK